MSRGAGIIAEAMSWDELDETKDDPLVCRVCERVTEVENPKCPNCARRFCDFCEFRVGGRQYCTRECGMRFFFFSDEEDGGGEE